MKFKKNRPFLDEVTAHGDLFKGPREVFICPECGSEHVKICEMTDFRLPNEGIFEILETRRECNCEDCGCEFKRIYGRKQTLSNTSKSIFLIIVGVILIVSSLVSYIFWFKMISCDAIGKSFIDEIIVGIIWGIGALSVIIFGALLIEDGSCDLR